jgi:hypothetical protein
MRSNRVRLILVTLFGLLALGALTAAAAQAVEAPRWSIGGTDLAEGQTHFITGKKYSRTSLRAGNVTLSCEVGNLVEGSLLGSSAGNAGKADGVIELSSCTVSGKAGGKAIEKCKVSEPIRTNAVIAELVESEGAEPAQKKGSLLVLFTPAAGTTFETIRFITETGGNCPPETKITGKVTGQVFTDPNTPPTLGTLVTLESGATEATSWLLNFPATQPKKIVRIIGGVAKEEANPGLTGFSEEIALEGITLGSLAKRETNGELKSEETKWSPLP